MLLREPRGTVIEVLESGGCMFYAGEIAQGRPPFTDKEVRVAKQGVVDR